MTNRKNRAVRGISRLDSPTVNYYAQPSTGTFSEEYFIHTVLNPIFTIFAIFASALPPAATPPPPLLGPLGESYVGVGGWRKVPLWPKNCGVAPKTNGYKTPKLAPVA